MRDYCQPEGESIFARAQAALGLKLPGQRDGDGLPAFAGGKLRIRGKDVQRTGRRRMRGMKYWHPVHLQAPSEPSERNARAGIG